MELIKKYRSVLQKHSSGTKSASAFSKMPTVREVPGEEDDSGLEQSPRHSTAGPSFSQGESSSKWGGLGAIRKQGGAASSLGSFNHLDTKSSGASKLGEWGSSTEQNSPIRKLDILSNPFEDIMKPAGGSSNNLKVSPEVFEYSDREYSASPSSLNSPAPVDLRSSRVVLPDSFI